MAHKAGFVNIIGNPNVGKSTLMNSLVGEKLSIITSKAQTTRHRIMGIVNGEDFQIIYSDTPGLLVPKYSLQEAMLKYAKSALEDADVLIYMTDVTENRLPEDSLIERLNTMDTPLMLLINKIDLSNQAEVEVLVEKWKALLPKSEILPLSALNNFNVEPIFKRLLTLLPESEPYFPKDELTDKSMRFFVSEIVREKILLNYQKEIPYSVEIEVEEYKEEPKIVHISTVIHVARDSQKGIIIGHKGMMLKKIGTQARIDIEEFIGKKVFLQLFVKVSKDWRDNKLQLKRFGYVS